MNATKATVTVTGNSIKQFQGTAIIVKNSQNPANDFLTLPLDESIVDVVISNGAINLSPKQACVFKEIFRVLKPHGRLYLADMIRLDTPKSSLAKSDNSADSWANCVAGTLSKACLERLISDTGFQDVTFVKMTGYHTAPETEGAV